MSVNSECETDDEMFYCSHVPQVIGIIPRQTEGSENQACKQYQFSLLFAYSAAHSLKVNNI